MTARLSPGPPIASASSWTERKPPSLARRNEIISDGQTVWVNSHDGMCIGRFSARGVDIHADAQTQMAGGTHCLDCIAGLSFDESWERFKRGMLDHHHVAVGDEHKPKPRKYRVSYSSYCGNELAPEDSPAHQNDESA